MRMRLTRKVTGRNVFLPYKNPADLHQPGSSKNVRRLAADAHFLHDPMAMAIAVFDGLHHALLVMHAMHLVHGHIVCPCGDAG